MRHGYRAKKTNNSESNLGHQLLYQLHWQKVGVVISFRWFLERRFELCVSTEILLEYEEKFQQFWGEAVAANLMGTLLTATNVSFHSIFYNFNLVDKDEDDNKFADTYLSADAEYLVSNDAALLRLNSAEFPKTNVLRLQDFAEVLNRS